MAFEIQVMRKRRMIEDWEDDDVLGMSPGVCLKLHKPLLSKTVAAVRMFRMLKAETNDEKVTTLQVFYYDRF